MKDFKVGMSLKTRLFPPAPAEGRPPEANASVRFMITAGGVPQVQPPLSPLLMHRQIYGLM